MAEKSFILNETDIQRKLQRMAFEVIENNLDTSVLILAGIEPNGPVIAGVLKDIIEKESAIKVHITSVSLNKKNPGPVTIVPTADYSGSSILVVDDVSMTGKTMLYALQPFLKDKPKKIQTLVLVERELKYFPVQSNFVGLHISTTLQDLIIVEQENGKLINAYLI